MGREKSLDRETDGQSRLIKMPLPSLPLQWGFYTALCCGPSANILQLCVCVPSSLDENTRQKWVLKGKANIGNGIKIRFYV